MKIATAKETTAPISFKHSRVVLREIKGKKVDKVKRILEDILKGKKNIDGKYYTKTVEKILDIVKSAEANAKQKNLAVDRLFIKNATADKGEANYRAKTRWNLRGRRQKSSNIEIVVEEK
jgi:ribosomal protein L22